MRSFAAFVVFLLSACLFPALAQEEMNAGFGVGVLGSYLNEEAPNGPGTGVLGTDYTGLTAFGKFGNKWGFAFSFRRVWSESLEPQETCCGRSDSSYQAIDVALFRQWLPDKIWRPHVKAGVIVGEFTLDYWEKQAIPALDIPGSFPKSETDSWVSIEIGWGFELGTKRYAFFFENNLFELGTVQYDYGCTESGQCGFRTDTKAVKTAEVILGFIFKFGE